MFDATSRYFSLGTEVLHVSEADGSASQIRYVRRRLLPKPDGGMTRVGVHRVQPGERLDNITARYFGDPTLFWRVCDAQHEPDPFVLVDRAAASGQVLVIGYRLPAS